MTDWDSHTFAVITISGRTIRGHVPTITTLGHARADCPAARPQKGHRWTGTPVLWDGSLDQMFARVATIWLDGEEYAVGEPWPCTCVPV
jgi:hypothetical protein